MYMNSILYNYFPLKETMTVTTGEREKKRKRERESNSCTSKIKSYLARDLISRGTTSAPSEGRRKGHSHPISRSSALACIIIPCCSSVRDNCVGRSCE